MPLNLRKNAADRIRSPLIREEAQFVVVEVCRLRPWRAEDLAVLLHRNSRHVRNTYLRPLTREGRLVMTNPNEPNDPRQAYRAADDQL